MVFQIKTLSESLLKKRDDLELLKQYRLKYIKEKKESKKQEKDNDMFNVARRFTRVLADDIPKAIQEKNEEIDEQIETLHRCKNKKNFELLLPVLRLG